MKLIILGALSTRIPLTPMKLLSPPAPLSDFLKAYKRETLVSSFLRTVAMKTLLILACILVVLTAHFTYIYLRRRNSFLRKLQGPEATSFFLGKYLDFVSHLRVVADANPQETRVTSAIKGRSETMSSSGCGNSVVRGVEADR